MDDVRSPDIFCPIRETIRLLGKKWTILIIKEIFYSKNHKLSFMELKRSLSEISTKVLSERLKEMGVNDLIQRRVISETTPVRVYYQLTEKGKDACDIIGGLKKYGLKWGSKTFTCENVDCELCPNKNPQ